MAEAEAEFTEITAEREFSRINSDLEKKELTPLKLMTREEWEEEREGS
jgi:hypothetical protein